MKESLYGDTWNFSPSTLRKKRGLNSWAVEDGQSLIIVAALLAASQMLAKIDNQ